MILTVRGLHQLLKVWTVLQLWMSAPAEGSWTCSSQPPTAVPCLEEQDRVSLGCMHIIYFKVLLVQARS